MILKKEITKGKHQIVETKNWNLGFDF